LLTVDNYFCARDEIRQNYQFILQQQGVMRRKYFIICLILISSAFFISFPQANNPQFQTPVFKNISIEDGLPENSVTCILQDYLGYLWLGTQNGLVKYDGYSMKIFQPEENNPGSISSRRIATIYEDRNNDLWIGTLNGLNKFNRITESFKSYKYDSDNTVSINSNLTHCIYEDKAGRLWVGTWEGLNLFDRDSEVFTRYYFRDGDRMIESASIPGEYNLCVNAVIEDPVTGDLLVGTEKDGLWEFDINNKVLSKFSFDGTDNPDEKIGSVQSFCKSSDGKIWMTSQNTLSSFNPQKKTFKSHIEFSINEEERTIKPSYINGTVIEDQDGLIWCGFSAGEMGIFSINKGSGDYQQYKISTEKRKHGYFNSVFSLYEDRSGILWIGTWQQGLKKFNRRKNEFNFLKFNFQNSSIKTVQSDIYSITYDPRGFIWFCTSDALISYNLETAGYKYYLQNEIFTSQSPYSVIIDNAGYIWAAVTYVGLLRLNPNDGSYRFYFNDPNESENLFNKPIYFSYQDHFDFLWIATEGFGLYKYSIYENKLTHYIHNPDDPFSLSQNQIRSIFEDLSGTLWVGTNLGGLNRYNRDKDNFTHYGFDCVMSIHEDKLGNFWIGDYFTGLNLFDREKGITLESYSKKDGFQSNAIYGMLEDDHNNLWLGTENGLTKFNTITKNIKHYYKEDGLQDDWFDFASRYSRGRDGRMYFNTRSGLVIFHPDSIIDDPATPQVVISGVTLFNRPGEKLNYDGFISELKEINLAYDQNDLRFDFVALHFSEPSKNSYKFILENFDKDWVDAGNQRRATYTNLDPGKYVFRVIATNKDGVWNTEGTSIGIIIKPPWWQTTIAYLLYVLVIMGILYLIWKMQLKRIRIEHEYEMNKFEADKMHEVDEIKSRFFTNISHEFRTPLTLILGPVKQIIDKTKDENTREKLNVVHKNARSLLGLVNQLLDISKIESGNMKLQTTPQNIIPLLKALFQSFCSYAERKKINLEFSSTAEEIIAYIDKEKMEKIITNILSNALKFTPEGGKISVAIREFQAESALPEDRLVSASPVQTKIPKQGHLPDGKDQDEDTRNFVEISISDTGIGIPENKLPNIFDRFYQVDGSHNREQEGTGIGLALTKELVDLHKGTIKVESIEGKGSTFTICIPLGKDHLKQDEITDPVKIKEEVRDLVIDEISTQKIKSLPYYSELIDEKDKKVLLIVEDNADVRNYIKDNLTEEYKIIEAADGEEGWHISLDCMPDLIVSDVMMPRMDGFELLSKLKTDERTSHIPIILLTAKATNQDKIEGYETGADDYIMKPFEPDVLKARVSNLIEQRKRIHEHFRAHGIIELDEAKISCFDKEFLKKVFCTISENLSNAAFNVEALADRLAVHRVLLHKKIVSLTGEPPVELIRRIRLKKASELLEKKFGNITEIAYEVGFNNPAYFSECFKKQFGVSPSHYNHEQINH
jgi:signal transduction histidine kinase/ligand-binding sensor domain-containing protein/DNA-binding response OmpR family regulator